MTTLAAYLSGQRMIERFTLRGNVVRLTLGEPVVAAMLMWWGLGLLPGWPEPSAIAYDAIQSLINVTLVGAVLTLVGAFQIVGSFLAWFGLVRPVKSLRMAALFASIFWWFFLASVLVLTGTMVSPVIYGGIGILTMEQYRKAYLAGGDTLL